MSRTYVGPFGRILPVSDDGSSSTSSLSDHENLSAGDTPSGMAARSLLSRAPLEFGSDPFPGFGHPQSKDSQMQSKNRYDHVDNGATDSDKVSHRPQQLPPFSQLLTPTSGFSAPNTPHSPSPNSSSPPYGNTSTNFYVGSERYPYPGRPSNQAALHPNVVGSSDNSQSSPGYQGHSAQQQHLGHAIPNHGQATTFGHQQRSPTYESVRQQPTQLASLNLGTQYAAHPQAYVQSSASPPATSPSYPARGTNTNVKPVPRVVREENIPGEGPCWLYEDGTIVPKTINGEAVNAQWGITKAGKPRKRLAIACSTCREKKIKCDPKEPKCVQCEKSGRQCRFTTA